MAHKRLRISKKGTTFGTTKPFNFMMITNGQPAPDFSLRDTQKNAVTLSSLRGKNVLILFFPLAFTSVCTKELCSVRDNIAFYGNANAEVLGISVDSLFALGKFKEEQNLNFTLLSDFNKEVSRAYGSIYEDWFNDMKGVSKRSAFVIDGYGVVRYAEVLENAGEVPNFEAINACLNSLK
jgi:peroxiredoxin